MKRNLPPLNALRAFEAAARHLSFKAAAEELNVTPAAVSHQVKALEDLVGASLFIRLTRALKLTDIGHAALPVLTHGFDKLAEGSDILRKTNDADVLRVSVSPGFGSIWLVPRLDDFYRRHPRIEVRIDSTDRRVDLRAGEADIAIRYGPGGYTGLTSDFLFDQNNTPVCSPKLLQGANPLREPSDLAHHTLLHIDWKDAEASWRMWLRAMGLWEVDPTKGPHFVQETMAILAALDGQGVALVGDQLVSDHLKKGDLVAPFKTELKTPLSFAYWLLCLPGMTTSPKIIAFRQWIIDEARQAQTS